MSDQENREMLGTYAIQIMERDKVIADLKREVKMLRNQLNEAMDRLEDLEGI